MSVEASGFGSEAVIVEAVRTPVGRRGGALSAWHPVDLLGATIADLIDRSGVQPELIDDVIAGCVLQSDQQTGNMARHAVLAAGLPESVPAVTIDRQCGSGQQAVSFAAQAVMAGSQDLVVACGVESMSQVPMPPAMTPGAPLGPQYSPRELARYDEAGGLMAQGLSSELMNTRFGFTRAELDEFGMRSHQRAAAATRAGYFRDQLVPLHADPADASSPVVDRDEGIRENLDPEKVAGLRTVFAEDGKTTAANSSQISDGAGALLIASREFAAEHGLRPRARFRALSVAADDPIIQFTAILEASRKALKKSGLTVDEIDLFEVNEAFAGVPLMFQREFGIPDDKLNVNGGSVAIGHPLGSTGARMLTDLLNELERSGKRFGLLTVCEATGTANATIIERLDQE
ncbi:thiolase family protein [Gordonia sp. (in: high G+C Gram-positive bacteria)]|uniref:thiolase family protein n=1 Tax=Gordonia sp. (in: high G+C Gram-positive bacteria) TaxID=84139 RepID=UPI0016B07C49|nr:thiolase family protein [Gordonia sp. (in: high G+C Gram-positive bacteria)]NLG46975.1 thiolase family protein [Gordonia sp. (in: high G+C Gram-positive bacteria)]